MRAGGRVTMPLHLRHHGLTWQRAIHAATAAVLVAMWVTALVMVVR
jgi:hypothetical protein